MRESAFKQCSWDFGSDRNPMASKSSRVQKEQLRKRRNNLLRRHNDFWRLYSIKSWLIMEAPDGRVFTYHSHPDLPAPTPQEMSERDQPPVHRTPLDFLDEAEEPDEEPRNIPASESSDAIWSAIFLYLNRRFQMVM